MIPLACTAELMQIKILYPMASAFDKAGEICHGVKSGCKPPTSREVTGIVPFCQIQPKSY